MYQFYFPISDLLLSTKTFLNLGYNSDNNDYTSNCGLPIPILSERQLIFRLISNTPNEIFLALGLIGERPILFDLMQRIPRNAEPKRVHQSSDAPPHVYWSDWRIF
ncbi:hypothetical protein AYI69_g10648 [Smittium culicis]|uniref:Uncharacterized protein n=1 Tax=Smittium culicis TaxID=133412 RepID=A0A1R1X4A0_9FUNG|nr:hypothetical protein AYI69_g10648 [Smittium culicis]